MGLPSVLPIRAANWSRWAEKTADFLGDVGPLGVHGDFPDQVGGLDGGVGFAEHGLDPALSLS